MSNEESKLRAAILIEERNKKLAEAKLYGYRNAARLRFPQN